MRKDIAFQSAGLTCRGWFFTGEGRGPRPTVVMSHGVTAVKEQHLESYAESFAAEGYSVLVFDYRYLGASDGEPRGRVIPQLQHDDIRAALTCISQHPDVDANRIALWGTSYSGGHALFVGALDPRVKAVLVQVPAINITHSLIALISRPVFDGLLGKLADDHAVRNAGGLGDTIPVVAEAGQPAFLASEDAYQWFTNAAKIAPNWLNSVSMESIARAAEYVPDALIELIAPRPLLMQVASKDSLIPINLARQAFHRAGEPKRLEVFDCGHFDPYHCEPWHSHFLAGQVRWLKEHL